MDAGERTRFTLKTTPGKGKGLFARAAFRRGDFIIEYTGKKIPTKVADTLTTRYLFEIDRTWTIDGSPRSNTARYINHACEPNCEADIRDGRIMLYATRNIAPGEELSFDYGTEYFDEFIRPSGCRCAARRCARPHASAKKSRAKKAAA